MDTATKEVIEGILKGQHIVHAMYELYVSSLSETQNFSEWIYYMIDIADITVNIDDYTNEDKTINYEGYYDAVYNQTKQFFKSKIIYAVDNWVNTDQQIEY